MPERRRFGLVNVVYVHSNTVLAGIRRMEEGAVWEGAGRGVESEQGTSKDGDLQPCTKSRYSK